MIDRRILYALLAFVFFIAGIVIYLPASVVTGIVAAHSPLRFEGVSGTMLNGRAAYVSLPSGGVQGMRWHIHPASLLLARLSADIRMDTDIGSLSARYTHTLFGANSVHDLDGHATIGWFAKLAGFTFVPVTGRVDTDIATLDFNDDMHVTALAGHVDVSDARYELLNPDVPLGAFQADLSETADHTLHLAINDSRGPLALAGSAELKADQHYLLDMRLRARAGADDRLKRLLGQLGQPGPDGWYPIRQRGQL